MFKELESLYSKILKPIVVRVKESWISSLFFVIFIYVALIPFLDYMRERVVKFPFQDTFSAIYNYFLNNFRDIDYYFSFIILTLVSFFIYFIRQLAKTNIATDYFDSKNLNKWSIPTEAGWTIQDCDDAPGKMLSITSTNEPGTLKEIYGWFDYEITFQFKIKMSKVRSAKNSVSIFVRTESSKNGIMLELDREKFNPYILHDGKYIQDTDGSSRLPTTLEPEKWYPIKIIVSGDCIDITVANYRLQQYRIQTRTFSVEKRVLNDVFSEPTLKDIVASDIKVTKSFDRWIGLYRKSSEEKDETKRSPEMIEEQTAAWDEYNKLDQVQIILEHQKGSVGFRAVGRTQTQIKNFIVKKIS